ISDQKIPSNYPPTFIANAVTEFIPLDQAQAFYEKLKGLGVPTEMITPPHGHATAYTQLAIQPTIDFFNHYVKNGTGPTSSPSPSPSSVSQSPPSVAIDPPTTRRQPSRRRADRPSWPRTEVELRRPGSAGRAARGPGPRLAGPPRRSRAPTRSGIAGSPPAGIRRTAGARRRVPSPRRGRT